MIKRPKKGEYAPFHEAYLKCLPPRGSARTLLRKTWREAVEVLGKLPAEKGDYAYAPGKWTIKQLIMHLIDTERVFSFRLLSFMRADRIGLPGFNQDFWMEEVHVEERTIKDLLKEWKAVRDNTLFLLEQCTEPQSRFVGVASNWKVSVRAYFYIIAGHQIHHMQVIRARYLADVASESDQSDQSE